MPILRDHVKMAKFVSNEAVAVELYFKWPLWCKTTLGSKWDTSNQHSICESRNPVCEKNVIEMSGWKCCFVSIGDSVMQRSKKYK